MLNGNLRVATNILIVMLGLCILSFGAFLFIALYPFQPIRVDSFVLEKSTVTQGEQQCFFFKGEKFHDVVPDVVIELINGEAIRLMEYRPTNTPGTVLRARCFNIPYHAKPGKYRIRWVATYPMFLIRRVVVKADSELFDVTANCRVKDFRGRQ